METTAASSSSSSADPSRSATLSSPSTSSDEATVEQLIRQLLDRDARERAMHDLSKKRDILHDHAPLLWNEPGAMVTLIKEIISIYRALSPPTLSASQSNRVCDALALLQSVASHQDTRIHFLNAYMPLYIYPFLNTTSNTRPFEYLRLSSLGVIGALVKVDDSQVINFLLTTEIVPLCLRSMDMGSELSKTVATFIVQKILLDDNGLQYICTTPVRVVAISRVLANMVHSLTEQPSSRLLKHIVRCYSRLSEDDRACAVMIGLIPRSLKDGTFSSLLYDDPVTRQWLQQLLHRVSIINRRISMLRTGGVFDQRIPV